MTQTTKTHSTQKTIFAGSAAFFAVFAAALALDQWQWSSDETLWRLYITVGAAGAAALASAVALCVYGMRLWRSGAGFALTMILSGSITGAAIYQLASTSPIPRTIVENTIIPQGDFVNAPTAAQTNDHTNARDLSLKPYQFWGMGLLLPQSLTSRISVNLPYEKGPPEKFLSRIILKDSKTGAFIAELHGPRPRLYKNYQVDPVFTLHNQYNLLRVFEYLPEIVNLELEAGLWGSRTSEGRPDMSVNPLGKRRPILTRTKIAGTPVEFIGSPWSGDSSEIRFIVRHNQTGVIHQVRLADATLKQSFEQIVLVDDLAAQRPQGRNQSQMRLRDEMAAAVENKVVNEALILRLVSLLTIDPRDPEAFYHLGKLTKDRNTLHAALRYGRDVGLAPTKLAELQSRFDNL
jgi:hypothetical protein